MKCVFFYLFLRKAVVGLKENLIAKKVVFCLQCGAASKYWFCLSSAYQILNDNDIQTVILW
jgi:hypothetical protein